MKLVYNASFGGFKLPQAYLDLHPEIDNEYCCWSDEYCEHRTDPVLIEMVEKDPDSDLAIAEFPDGLFYTSFEYDGSEMIYVSESPIKYWHSWGK